MKIFYALFLIIAAMFGMAMAETYTYTIPASQAQQQKKHGHGHRQGIVGRGLNAGANFLHNGKNKAEDKARSVADRH